MVTATGCVQLNEAMNSRDLECGGVPEDICARLADHIVRHWDPEVAARLGPIVLVTVEPADCRRVERQVPGMVKCWQAMGSPGVPEDDPGWQGSSWRYYQNVEGLIFDERGGVVVGY